ncbi:MAG TPA: hypothetical protein PLA50_14835 [Bacteroidia bacterium]|nr:hypothetical protein [Bacteroidia bacterium]
MSLKITERKHWKKRIGACINAEIAKLKASDPSFFQRMVDEARRSICEKLGIAAEQDRLRKLDRQIAALQDEYRKVQYETARKLRQGIIYNPEALIEGTIQELVPAEEERLMEEYRIGRRFIELNRKRESLTDAVWSASSFEQIEEVWREVDALLGVPPASFQLKFPRN